MTEMYRIARNSAETIEDKCQPQTEAYRWCSRHHSQWHAGSAACVAMEDYILLGEQAINYAEPLIRADEREQIANGGIKWVADRALADLRAKVKALPSEYDAAEELHYVVLDDVLALLPEKEKP